MKIYTQIPKRLSVIPMRIILQVLTLASNERIYLTPNMWLIFEISHLRSATPATVSRAGILYINSQDLGWNPYVDSTFHYNESIPN